jgi:uncharacterized phiE125 gp8 family phage protein
MTWLPHMVSVLPASEPVTLAEVKYQCNITDTTSDTLLTSYIAAARAYVEAMCGFKLVDQTLNLRASSWCDLKHFLVRPISAITSIKYLDELGVEQTLADTVYRLVDGRHPSVVLKPSQVWPAIYAVEDAIRIVATVGFGDIDDVPANIKQAIYLLVSSWFESREDQVAQTLSAPLANGVKALLTDFWSL